MSNQTTLSLDKIVVRSNIREQVGDVTGLAQSIESLGLLQPLLVYAENGHYVLVDGHRRFAAATEAGLTEVPVYVQDEPADDATRIAEQIVANLQRQDLDPIEEAKAFQSLVDTGWPQKDVAQVVGVHQSHVSKRLKLLRLPEKVQAKVASGKIPAEIGYKLADVEDEATIQDLLDRDCVAQPWRIDSALARQKQNQQTAKFREAVEAAGVDVSDPGDINPVRMQRVDVVYDLADAKKFQPEEGQRVTVQYGSEGPGLYVWEAVASSTDDGEGPSAEEKAERRRQNRIKREALEQWETAIASAVTNPAKADIFGIAARVLFYQNSYQAPFVGRAARMLGIEPHVTEDKTVDSQTGEVKVARHKDWAGPFRRFAEESERNFVRALAAILCAHHDPESGTFNISGVADWLDAKGVPSLQAIRDEVEESLTEQ